MSAFSTWEKELHKIVFDPRYLLLNPEERKQVSERCPGPAHLQQTPPTLPGIPEQLSREDERIP